LSTRWSILHELGIADVEADFRDVEEIDEVRDELRDFFIPHPRVFKRTEDREALISNVKYSWSNIIGAPMSGKTSLALTIAHDVEVYYEDKGFSVHTVVTPLLADGIQKLPEDTQIAVIIVDDALLTSFASGRTRADILNVGAYMELRHLLIRRCPDILFADIMYTVQRFRSLDIVFRGASRLTIFKTAENEPSDNEAILALLRSKRLLKFLFQITEGLYRYHDTRYAKYFVYATTWGTRGIVGIKKVKQPLNLTVSRELREMLLAEFSRPTPSVVRSAVNVLIAHSASMGVSWYVLQNEVLPVLRKQLKIKIDQNRAHEIWKRYHEVGATIGNIIEEVGDEYE